MWAGDDVIGLDAVFSYARGVASSVWAIEARESEAGGRRLWSVRITGDREYGVSLNVEGHGDDLELACRSTIRRLEELR